MLRRLYDWTLNLAAHPRAEAALALVSFSESSFFPIPPDVLLIAMVMARPDRAWRFALICTLASVLGGMAGYAIGYFLFESAGQWIIAAYGLQAEFQSFKATFQEWGFWIVMAKGLTPIPYKLVTITSGVAGLDIGAFTLASALTRGFRFFLVAGLMWRFGAPMRGFIERHLTTVTTLALIALIGGFVVIKYLL